MSTQDPYQQPPQYTGDLYGTPPPQYTGEPYGTPPAPQHPAFAPYGSPMPEYGHAAPQYGAPQYGAPQYGAPQYGAMQYGAPVYGYPGAGFVVAPSYAHWGMRVAAMLLDLLTLAPYWIGAAVSGALSTTGYDQFGQPTSVSTPAGSAAVAVGALVSFGLWVWNRGVLQARTGQSWGKKVLGLRLALEATGENVGVARALLRDLAHWFDCWLLGLGFWFPLWDAKRQTFADKIAKTVSVR